MPVPIVKFVMPEQSSKAHSPRKVTLSGIVISVKPEHLLKAAYSMCVTLSGMVTVVRPVQLRKAELFMVVTGSPSMVGGMTNSPEAELSHSLMATSVCNQS